MDIRDRARQKSGGISALVRPRAVGWAAVLVLVASSLAPSADIGVVDSVSQGFVDGASSRCARTGGLVCEETTEAVCELKNLLCPFPGCSPLCGEILVLKEVAVQGPFRKVGEGVRGVVPGGVLSITAGSYSEPIVLNKKMSVQSSGGTVRIGPASLAPFDLVADTVDDNGLPLNPKWGAQRNDGAFPNPDSDVCPHFDVLDAFNCTHQFTYTDSGSHVVPVKGPPFVIVYSCGPHVNWFGATYCGTIKWNHHECPGPCGDNDYNMDLIPHDMAGLTSANPTT